jgi:hypothetical protein
LISLSAQACSAPRCNTCPDRGGCSSEIGIGSALGILGVTLDRVGVQGTTGIAAKSRPGILRCATDFSCDHGTDMVIGLDGVCYALSCNLIWDNASSLLECWGLCLATCLNTLCERATMEPGQTGAVLGQAKVRQALRISFRVVDNCWNEEHHYGLTGDVPKAPSPPSSMVQQIFC